MSERRFTRSPIRDLIGMHHSFRAAVLSALQAQAGRARIQDLESNTMVPWCRFWFYWINNEFLSSWLQTTRDVHFLPPSRSGQKVMFDVYLLEKAIYELGCEMDHNPGQLTIPLRGILQLLHHGEE